MNCNTHINDYDSIKTFYNLDILKIILAYLIVLRHAGQSFFEPDSLFYYVITNTISTIGVPLYFIISGFLYFYKGHTMNRLIKQIKRILRLYLVWSIIYMPTSIIKYSNAGGVIPSYIINYIKNALFSGTHYHLWFLPSLVFSLCFIIILSNKLNTKKLLAISLGLFATAVLTDTYNFILPESIKEIYSLYQKIFITSRNGLFFGSIYICIGKYFSEKDISKINFHIKTQNILLIFFLETYYLCFCKDRIINNICIMALPISVILFATSFKYDIHSIFIEKYSYLLRNMSTLIFCMHPIVIISIKLINMIFRNLNTIEISGGFAAIVTVLSVTVLTLILLKLSNYIKVIKNLY